MAEAGASVVVLTDVLPPGGVIWLPNSWSVAAYAPMPGRMVVVHPALVAVHGVIVVPGSVYPAAQERISCVPVVFSVEKPIQLMPLSELTASRWLRPTGLLVLVALGLPMPCAQCGQLADGVGEWQLFTVNTLEKSALPDPMSPVQMYFANAPLLRK